MPEAYDAAMPQLPQHERLASLTEDVVSQLLEETRIGAATASLVRMQVAALRELLQVEELQPSGLIALVDATEILLRFLTQHVDHMYNSQCRLFEKLKAEITGLPPPPKNVRLEGMFHFPV